MLLIVKSTASFSSSEPFPFPSKRLQIRRSLVARRLDESSRGGTQVASAMLPALQAPPSGETREKKGGDQAAPCRPHDTSSLGPAWRSTFEKGCPSANVPCCSTTKWKGTMRCMSSIYFPQILRRQPRGTVLLSILGAAATGSGAGSTFSTISCTAKAVVCSDFEQGTQV